MFSPLVTISLLASSVAGRSIGRYTNKSSTQYDYLIVGGGLTGLVAATRLSEDPNVSVLVLEYGDFDRSNTTQIPYYGTTLNTASMRAVQTAPEPYLNDTVFSIYTGAVPGGGSQVNGMQWDYPSKADIDSWEVLGNPGWGWDGLLPYFKKSNTFTSPDPEIEAVFNYTYDPTNPASAYGDAGLAQVSPPEWQWPDMYTIKAGLAELDVPFIAEHSEGNSVGQYWTGADINPVNKTRSSSLYGYYDTVSNRPNLKLLTLHQAIEILFASNSSSLVATGVKALNRSSNTSVEFTAKKEVILAAGAVWTPHLLQLSGIGPKAVLEAAGVATKLDMPAVGSNFQDHPVMYLQWTINNTFPSATSLTTNTTFWNEAVRQYYDERTGPLTKASASYLAMLNLSAVAGTEEAEILLSALEAQEEGAYLPDIYSSNPALVAGYEAQRASLTTDVRSGAVGVLELPVTGAGRTANALEKTFSRGTVHLNASNPYGDPVLQYNALQNPFDKSLMSVFVSWSRKLWATNAVASLNPVETVPGPAATTEEEILAAVLASPGVTFSPSFAHPSCTCPMMPEELGGVVNPDLLVYGTQKLSIIDASIIPIVPASHLQSVMYGIAEKASDIIKSRT
ncbi:putative Choline dehydrogenase [Seiridium cardinale]